MKKYTAATAFGVIGVVMFIGILALFMGWEDGEWVQMGIGAAMVIGAAAIGVHGLLTGYIDEPDLEGDKPGSYDYQKFINFVGDLLDNLEAAAEDTVDLMERWKPIIRRVGNSMDFDNEEIDEIIDAVKHTRIDFPSHRGPR